MRNLTGGFTVEEYVELTHSLIFEVRNCLMVTVGFGELAQKELEPSHPAVPYVSQGLQAAERAFAAVKQFDREYYRRKQEAEKRETNLPDGTL